MKDSSSGGGTGTSSDHDPADREILSSSLPTPPPPPAQVSRKKDIHPGHNWYNVGFLICSEVCNGLSKKEFEIV